MLLLWYKSGIQTSPPIIPLDRGGDFAGEGQLSFIKWRAPSMTVRHFDLKNVKSDVNNGSIILSHLTVSISIVSCREHFSPFGETN